MSEKKGSPLYSTDGQWACSSDGLLAGLDLFTLVSSDSATCEITKDDIAVFGLGDRLTSGYCIGD